MRNVTHTLHKVHSYILCSEYQTGGVLPARLTDVGLCAALLNENSA
jgi:hypothetical protein